MKKQLFLLSLILLLAVGCNKAQAPVQTPEGEQAEEQTNVPGTTVEFTKTYRTGF